MAFRANCLCMKCQIQFTRNNKKNIISLSSAEFAHSIVSIKSREISKGDHSDLSDLTIFALLLNATCSGKNLLPLGAGGANSFL